MSKYNGIPGYGSIKPITTETEHNESREVWIQEVDYLQIKEILLDRLLHLKYPKSNEKLFDNVVDTVPDTVLPQRGVLGLLKFISVDSITELSMGKPNLRVAKIQGIVVSYLNGDDTNANNVLLRHVQVLGGYLNNPYVMGMSDVITRPKPMTTHNFNITNTGKNPAEPPRSLRCMTSFELYKQLEEPVMMHLNDVLDVENLKYKNNGEI